MYSSSETCSQLAARASLSHFSNFPSHFAEHFAKNQNSSAGSCLGTLSQRGRSAVLRRCALGCETALCYTATSCRVKRKHVLVRSADLIQLFQPKVALTLSSTIPAQTYTHTNSNFTFIYLQAYGHKRTVTSYTVTASVFGAPLLLLLPDMLNMLSIQ